MGGVHSRQMWTASLCWPTRSFCAASHHRAYDYESPFWDDVASRLIAAIVCRLRTHRGPVCPADIHESLELPRKQLLKLLNDGPEMPFAVGLASFIESGSHKTNESASFLVRQANFRRTQLAKNEADSFWP